MIEFLVYIFTIASIWGLLALSLNLQYGLAGLVNLGHIGFFALGAYVSTILVVYEGQSIVIGMIAGAAAAMLLGVLMALPTARLQQDYWAISTLAVAEIVRIIFLNMPLGEDSYSGQAFGVSNIPRPFRTAFEEAGLSQDQYNLFYLAMAAALLLAAFLLVRWLASTPFGRTLKAIREGDSVPLALGKHVGSFRMRVMAIGGAIAGLAGALYAHYTGFVSPEYFLPVETFLIWAMVILGGAGNFTGALVGTLIIMLISNSTRFIAPLVNIDAGILGPLRMILIGVMIVLVILFLPKGLVPERRRRYDR